MLGFWQTQLMAQGFHLPSLGGYLGAPQVQPEIWYYKIPEYFITSDMPPY